MKSPANRKKVEFIYESGEEVFSRKQKSLGLAEITFDGKRKPARSVSATDEIKKVQKF